MQFTLNGTFFPQPMDFVYLGHNERAYSYVIWNWKPLPPKPTTTQRPRYLNIYIVWHLWYQNSPNSYEFIHHILLINEPCILVILQENVPI